MKHELDNKFYDNAYLSAGKYDMHYSKTPYKNVWNEVLEICKGLRVADFGCGVGQLADMMIDNNVDYSYGVDFSAVAINKCKRLKADFYRRSLYDDVYNLKPYDIALFLEVLEHVQKDIDIIKSVPEGREIILTVPNWDSSSHVRHFKSLEEAKERYSFLKDVFCSEHKIGNSNKYIYLINGIR